MRYGIRSLILGSLFLFSCQAISGVGHLEIEDDSSAATGDGDGDTGGTVPGDGDGDTGGTDSGNGDTGGTDSGDGDTGGTDSGDGDTGGTGSGGAASGGTGSGGLASGGTSSGGAGSGGGVAYCADNWRSNTACKGTCGDSGSGTDVGCGNQMDCFATNDCDPAVCSVMNSSLCGINNINSGSPNALTQATAVYDCLCDTGSGGSGGSGSGGSGSGGSGSGEPPDFVDCSTTPVWTSAINFTASPTVQWQGNLYSCTNPLNCLSFYPLAQITWYENYDYVGLCGTVNICEALPVWTLGTSYITNQQVQHLGRRYQCYAPALCGVREPRTSHDAWSPAGTCAESCFNSTTDDSETCVDGGGSCTATCADGEACVDETDCTSGFCSAGKICMLAHCGNGAHDPSDGEVDVDCGGDCEPCPDDSNCGNDDDCYSRNCVSTFCEPNPSCVFDYWQDTTCIDAYGCSLGQGGTPEGCRNFLECYIDQNCSPETCSTTNDDTCGINKSTTGAPSP